MEATEINRNFDTPLMKQYCKFKEQCREALLFMRVGDFYEAYGDDAIVASRVLGIILTNRSNGMPTGMEMCGFPHHAINNYVPKLIQGGYKVSICDQLEDPKLAKGIVKRGITELVTPGVAYQDELLAAKENNFLATVEIAGSEVGVAFVDVSTGEFRAGQGNWEYIRQLFADFKPKEVVVQKDKATLFKENFKERIYITTMDEWAFAKKACLDKLNEHFGENALKGFGIEELPLAKVAAGTTLFYLEQNCMSQVIQFGSISRIDSNEFVWLDDFTKRNLEIFATVSQKGVSLLQTIDKTTSPMGARLLRVWLNFPLKNISEIEKRYDGVAYFIENQDIRRKLREALSNIGDIERIVVRAMTGKIVPRAIMQLKRGLDSVALIKELLVSFREIAGLEDFRELNRFITKTLVREPAVALGKGDVIAEGVDIELDKLRAILHKGKAYIDTLQQTESEKTGIPSLKIGYNNVFGYYLEVRNAYKRSVPPEWIRKQTLVSAERYITPELKAYEEKILGAEESILAIEQRIYAEVVAAIQKNAPAIQLCCKALAELDCISAFAELAFENNYCRPQIDESVILDIKQGRHPVLEKQMPIGQEYVANDLYLDNSTQQIMILTGPNMAGKSALLRQTALIVLMAQCGSFTPAAKARIGLTDKIFTRVGASDNISQGESTFMVEMIETAAILHNLSDRSLVLLDEIGRGTSTFDGMSIAWAIVEYLHNNPVKAKTIFATHYHELNELENLLSRVKNFHIEVKKSGNNIIFLRKLERGGVAHSFGLEVARLAGMPASLLTEAEKKLTSLEQERQKQGSLSLFPMDDPTLIAIRAKLKGININTLSLPEAIKSLQSIGYEVGLRI